MLVSSVRFRPLALFLALSYIQTINSLPPKTPCPSVLSMEALVVTGDFLEHVNRQGKESSHGYFSSLGGSCSPFSKRCASASSGFLLSSRLRFHRGLCAGLLRTFAHQFESSGTWASLSGDYHDCCIEGAAGVRRLLGRIVLWRVGVQWYLFAIPGIFVISLLGTIVLPGALASYHAPSTGFLLNIPLNFVVSFLIGPLFEEVGWRGFALPRMQRLQGPLIGSLLLGLLWAFWHLPLFLVPDFASQNGGLSLASFSMLALGAIAISIIMTWVFNNTRGSLLIIMLIHNSVNVSQGVVGSLFPGVNSNPNILIGFGVTALVIVLVTRGRLGYQTERSVGTGG